MASARQQRLARQARAAWRGAGRHLAPFRRQRPARASLRVERPAYPSPSKRHRAASKIRVRVSTAAASTTQTKPSRGKAAPTLKCDPIVPGGGMHPHRQIRLR
jgi:hypothetical protein